MARLSSRRIGLATTLATAPTAAVVTWSAPHWMVIATIGMALLGVFILAGGVLFSRSSAPSDRLQKLVQVLSGHPPLSDESSADDADEEGD